IENFQVCLVVIGIAGHGVLVSFQSGPGIGQGIDDPERLHLALIVARDGELLRVLRPRDVGAGACAAGLAFALLLFAGVVLLLLLLVLNLLAAGAAASAVTEVFLAVFRDLSLHDGRIIGVLQRLGIIHVIHRVE